MVCVAADVLEHLLGAGEGRLRVDDPVGLSRRREVLEQRVPIAQCGQGPEELERAGVECGFETCPMWCSRSCTTERVETDTGRAAERLAALMA